MSKLLRSKRESIKRSAGNIEKLENFLTIVSDDVWDYLYVHNMWAVEDFEVIRMVSHIESHTSRRLKEGPINEQQA